MKAAATSEKHSEADGTQFLRDVLAGLSSTPKKLNSKYFYDKTGDALFQQIMAMPDYYLTRREMEIFSQSTDQIATLIKMPASAFDIIELGAGDATKSVVLLRKLLLDETEFSYFPIDISANILKVLENKLSELPQQLQFTTLNGDYFAMLKKAIQLSDRRKVVLFLGSNIGNMEPADALQFCLRLRANLTAADILLIGFDLMKDPKTILAAYNDSEGLTAAFNLNLLARINSELEADFDLAKFTHYQNYDPISGACRSYLVSLEQQHVSVRGMKVDFLQNEIIQMEISQKYSPASIQQLASDSGFKVIENIFDSECWFACSLWQTI